MKHNLLSSFFAFIALVLIIGCGGEEEEMKKEEDSVTKPETSIPNYFPDSIGSRWVYRSSNGVQWAREVTGTRVLNGQVYQVFAYDPPIENPEFDYIRTPSYRVTLISVLFFVGGEIDRSVEREITANLQEGFADAGNIKVTVNARSKNDLVFFRIPPFRGKQWEVINMQIKGNVLFQDLANFKLPFEINWVITGVVVREEIVETPAGVFNDSFKIQYDTKITTIFEGEKETSNEQIDTIWLAPEVGIVKIQDGEDVVELIEYDVKPKPKK